MGQHFLEFLDTTKSAVSHLLLSYLPDRYPRYHYGIVREYPLRQGKYVRPGLVLLGTELFGGNPKAAMRVAAAMQCSEEWLLIHDDIEDHSEVRRSTQEALNPTLNVLYGDALALNAGDALHVLMWRIMGDAVKEFEPEKGWRIFEKMSDILLTTIEGQGTELEWIHKGRMDVSEEEYFEMIGKKSAWYTVIGPLQLGAIIAGASRDDVESIADWAMPCGMAFQIRDDMLSILAHSFQSGKREGEDIIEGKRTLLLIHLLNSCTSTERAYLEVLYRRSRSEILQRDVHYIISLMRHYGSIAYAERTALEYAAEADLKFNAAVQLKTPEAKATAERIRDAIHFFASRMR